ncbi:MAG TPA: amidohydrolase family protein [Bacillota bacterium]|jgi:predicted TIM-barrel fold metal-dependent hydrolase|nr:amidohydrolase family protein [Bacillota bacterium]
MNSLNITASSLGVDKIFDVHSHIGATPYLRQDIKNLLEEMDASEVEKSAICPMGAHIVCRNAEGNDFIGSIVAAHPDRFVGFATVNPWFEDDAIRELQRSVAKWNLSGLKLHPPMQGFQANDKIVFPVIEEAIRLGLPIYIHSGTPVSSLPLQILELARRYPEGSFILGHLGGGDFFLDVPLAFPAVDNVYVETSLTCHPVFVLQAIESLGSHRVLFGSDSPNSEINTELEKIRGLGLDRETLNQVLWRNAETLLVI